MSDDYWRKPSPPANAGQGPSSFGGPSRGVMAPDDNPTGANAPARAAEHDVTTSGPDARRGHDAPDGSSNSDLAAKARSALGTAKDKATTVASKAGTAVTSAASSATAAATAAAKEATASPTTSRRTRKARLRLSRIDPWSVMKTAFLFGIAGGIILFISVWVLWGVIGASGVFESVNKAVNDLVASPGAEQRFRLEDYLNTNKILGFTAMMAAADVVIFTALATLFSFLYNLSATVLGGLEVTLAED